MERDVWSVVTRALKRLTRRRRRNAVYSSAEVLAVLLWAALHDRSISWACRRSSWPVQAWRRRLPSQPTMSRRLRDPAVLEDLRALLELIQGRADQDAHVVLAVDGKPLPVSCFSADPQARTGWGAGQHQRGYKLHALVASARRLVAFEVLPMNHPEAQAAAELVATPAGRAACAGATVLADASYDTNPLHAACRAAGARLLAPRRRPEMGLATNRRHDPGRLASVALLEGDPGARAWARRRRQVVEHYFAGLVSGAGLHALPPWVRGLTRVRVWTAAKIALNAARLHRPALRLA